MYRKSTGELIEAATSLNDTVLQEATINARQAMINYLKPVIAMYIMYIYI